MDETVFMRYFSVPKDNYIHIKGASFPIQDFYSKYNI
jgi:hypothetical protein